MGTVLVKGLSSTHNESVLKLYFTNKKKSGGGDVKSVTIEETHARVSFVDPKGNNILCYYVCVTHVKCQIKIQIQRL